VHFTYLINLLPVDVDYHLRFFFVFVIVIFLFGCRSFRSGFGFIRGVLRKYNFFRVFEKISPCHVTLVGLSCLRPPPSAFEPVSEAHRFSAPHGLLLHARLVVAPLLDFVFDCVVQVFLEFVLCLALSVPTHHVLQASQVFDRMLAG